MEVKGLSDQNKIIFDMTSDVSLDANVLPGRFVLAFKSTNDNETTFKVKCVIACYTNKLKKIVVHSSQTIQPSLIGDILMMATTHKWVYGCLALVKHTCNLQNPSFQNSFFKTFC